MQLYGPNRDVVGPAVPMARRLLKPWTRLQEPEEFATIQQRDSQFARHRETLAQAVLACRSLRVRRVQDVSCTPCHWLRVQEIESLLFLS